MTQPVEFELVLSSADFQAQLAQVTDRAGVFGQQVQGLTRLMAGNEEAMRRESRAMADLGDVLRRTGEGWNDVRSGVEEHTDRLGLLGERGEQMRGVLEQFSDPMERVRRAQEEWTRATNPGFLDRLAISANDAQASVSLFVARLGPLAGIAGGALAAVGALGGGLLLYAGGAAAAYIESNEDLKKSTEAVAKAQQDLKLAVGEVVVEATDAEAKIQGLAQATKLGEEAVKAATPVWEKHGEVLMGIVGAALGPYLLVYGPLAYAVNEFNSALNLLGETELNRRDGLQQITDAETELAHHLERAIDRQRAHVEALEDTERALEQAGVAYHETSVGAAAARLQLEDLEKVLEGIRRGGNSSAHALHQVAGALRAIKQEAKEGADSAVLFIERTGIAMQGLLERTLNAPKKGGGGGGKSLFERAMEGVAGLEGGAGAGSFGVGGGLAARDNNALLNASFLGAGGAGEGGALGREGIVAGLKETQSAARSALQELRQIDVTAGAWQNFANTGLKAVGDQLLGITSTAAKGLGALAAGGKLKEFGDNMMDGLAGVTEYLGNFLIQAGIGFTPLNPVGGPIMAGAGYVLLGLAGAAGTKGSANAGGGSGGGRSVERDVERVASSFRAEGQRAEGRASQPVVLALSDGAKFGGYLFRTVKDFEARGAQYGF